MKRQKHTNVTYNGLRCSPGKGFGYDLVIFAMPHRRIRVLVLSERERSRSICDKITKKVPRWMVVCISLKI